jgi:serine/threonine protein phosphatase PrpC
MKAIFKGFENAEKEFFLENKPRNILSDFDRSGSCALVLIIVDEMCYVANLGDSRALVSEQYGNRIYPLTKDHKPDEEIEKKRILANGGRVYQGVLDNIDEKNKSNSNCMSDDIGNSSRFPWRIFPGKLSVTFFNY